MPVEARADKARKFYDAEPEEWIAVDPGNRRLSEPTLVLFYVLLDPTAQ